MSRRGDLYENAVTGERAVVLRGDEDGGGASILVHLRVRPGGAVAGEHVHPRITERFQVLAGTLGTAVAGVEGRLTAGQAATVPPGVAHRWWNAGDQEAGVIVEITPPEPRFERMIATLFGLANTGRTNAKGLPHPLQLALVADEFADVVVFTRPPAAVQRIVFGCLAPIARRRGLKPMYPELLAPHGSVEPDPDALAAAGLGAQPG